MSVCVLCVKFQTYVSENTDYLQNLKINLQEQAGQPLQIPCDIVSYQEETKWIEWRNCNTSTLVLVKYPNYQLYISPEFSTRFSMDKYGGLMINPLFQQDAATYKCRSVRLWNNRITQFIHGSSVNLKIEGNCLIK